VIEPAKTKSKKFEIVATVYDRKGRVLSVGHNSYVKSHPEQSRYAIKAGLPEKQFLHAEILSLVRVKHGIPHKIKIERYGKMGQPLNAAPCPVCQLAIKEAGIKFIEHTVG
jgi:tRNA(Arg) A34 adenosine deaminase TadA